ncbi:unnamed protein product [Acanthoscelides obtectus]|uniref:Uncharacterized protein n=1 Tax=Acanthoscelides obtectus TaxID=200917 RepID=A0A9P0KZM1_ACAOB|nr:unnamed protein product [Acanthoscelides obtectus]CAK1630075.1 hypothetical protein AOBTE_LOCUS6143 [Acanthoscelides obtectus]
MPNLISNDMRSPPGIGDWCLIFMWGGTCGGGVSPPPPLPFLPPPLSAPPIPLPLQHTWWFFTEDDAVKESLYASSTL